MSLLTRLTKRRPGGAQTRLELTDEQVRTVWAAASLLLDYPTAETLAKLPLILDACDDLPPMVAEPLARTARALAGSRLEELQPAYVRTFDHTRRCCLYLTYAAYGDTRRRGVALVQVKQVFRRHGLELSADELPDHLAVILEFGASGGAEATAAATTLLTDYRAGLELLRIALGTLPEDEGGRWAGAAAAVCATLPSLGDDEQAALGRLIEAGPPGEDVGMDGYALDPRLHDHGGPGELDAHGHSAFGGHTGHVPHPQQPAYARETHQLGATIPVGAPR